MKISQRQLLNLIAFICLASVAFALFSQHVLGMLPCAWCVFQRLIFIVIALVCLLVNLSSSLIYQKILALIAALLAIGGVVAAWYQTTVASVSFSCDMTFADIFMSRQTSLDAALPWLFGIYATCMDAAVKLFGVEYSVWALILFAALAIVLLVSLFRKS
ncbi:MAG: disulfide bond formation protein B [Alcaligenaceae bacterium]|nr:disulfide bond formation protein B [Alcaligenaceae bacterium]